MIKNIDEFLAKYGRCDIVNYDIAKVFTCGLVFKSGSKNNRIERFYKRSNGVYIDYPEIQEYAKPGSNIKIFIIKDGKMYKLKDGEKEKTYKIDFLVEDVDPVIFDDLFYKAALVKDNGAVVINEDLYKIVE